jgi:hypothetical protein
MRHQMYEVTFAGEAGATMCAAFDDCEITAGSETTTVRAELPDQAGVMGLLWRITGLGLELIEMHRVATQGGARNEWPPPARRGLPARGRRLALESRSGAGNSPALSTPTRGARSAALPPPLNGTQSVVRQLDRKADLLQAVVQCLAITVRHCTTADMVGAVVLPFLQA